jgi:hypothetical protein
VPPLLLPVPLLLPLLPLLALPLLALPLLPLLALPLLPPLPLLALPLLPLVPLLPLLPLLPLVPLLPLLALPLLALPLLPLLLLPLPLAPDEPPPATVPSWPSGASPSVQGLLPASPDSERAPDPLPLEPEPELPGSVPLPPLSPICTDGPPSCASLELPMLTSGKLQPATVQAASTAAHDATAQRHDGRSRRGTRMTQ